MLTQLVEIDTNCSSIHSEKKLDNSKIKSKL